MLGDGEEGGMPALDPAGAQALKVEAEAGCGPGDDHRGQAEHDAALCHGVRHGEHAGPDDGVCQVGDAAGRRHLCACSGAMAVFLRSTLFSILIYSKTHYPQTPWAGLALLKPVCHVRQCSSFLSSFCPMAPIPT